MENKDKTITLKIVGAEEFRRQVTATRKELEKLRIPLSSAPVVEVEEMPSIFSGSEPRALKINGNRVYTVHHIDRVLDHHIRDINRIGVKYKAAYVAATILSIVALSMSMLVTVLLLV